MRSEAINEGDRDGDSSIDFERTLCAFELWLCHPLLHWDRLLRLASPYLSAVPGDDSPASRQLQRVLVQLAGAGVAELGIDQDLGSACGGAS